MIFIDNENNNNQNNITDMAIYLKKFETQAAYEAAQSELILPNVSLTVDNNTVHYNPSSPTPSYETVDLGLPSGTLWAKYNVGATSETEYGNYYQYGKGADDYSVTSGQSDYSGTEDPLATSADTAAQVWGTNWHIPTQAQLKELTANTTYEWTTINGVNGAKFTAQNGNYIFIPAAGYYYNDSVFDAGVCGHYWGSSPGGSNKAYHLFFSNNIYGKGVYNVDRNSGYSVRPVIG